MYWRWWLQMRTDLEECVGKMRVLQDRQAQYGVVEKEAAFLRGALESRQVFCCIHSVIRNHRDSMTRQYDPSRQIGS